MFVYISVRLRVRLSACVFVGTCLSVCFPQACVSYSPKQAYLGRAVALTGSPWELAAKAFTIAFVMQDYNQDMYKRIGRLLLYPLAQVLFYFCADLLRPQPSHALTVALKLWSETLKLVQLSPLNVTGAKFYCMDCLL